MTCFTAVGLGQWVGLCDRRERQPRDLSHSSPAPTISSSGDAKERGSLRSLGAPGTREGVKWSGAWPSLLLAQ